MNRTMKSLVLRPMRAGAMAIVAAAAALAVSARAQVLDQVPADALVVAKVNNMQQVSDKAGALAKQWGLVEMNPAAADPLGHLLQQGNVEKGVDKSGDFAVVLANGDLNGAQPPLIILMPVSDYDQFLGNFPGAAKEGELDHFKMKVGGEEDKEETYSAHWGKYAALSPIKDLLSKKPEGFKITGVTAKEVASKDAVVVANFKVLGPKLNEQLKGEREKVLGEIEKNLSGDPEKAKYVPLAKAVVGQLINAASEFLTDCSAASFSVNLNKEGIGTSLMAEFTEGTYLGKAFGEMKPASGSLLAGLPDGKYIVFGGGVVSDQGRQMLSDFFSPIEAELGKAGDQVKPVVSMLDGMKKLMAASKGQTFGVMAPTGAIGQTALIQTVSVITGDTKAIMAAEQQVLESQQQIMALLPNQPQGGMKMEFKPNAKTVDGVEFAQFTTTFGGDANSPEVMQIKQMMAMMYGPNGPTGYMGPVDDQHLLVISGLDDAMTSSAIKAAKSGNDTLSKTPGVMLVDKNLPQQKTMAFYLGLGDLVSTASNYAKMMGVPIPINVKADLPPIGVAGATEGTAFRIDSFVPADLIEQMIATGMQLKMMGGGGNGKPGGL